MRKYDLLENDEVRSIFKDRMTQFLFQIPGVLFLVIVIFAGFYGVQNSNMNLATVSIWVIWWSLIIVSLALFGRLWCLLCPFGAIGDWVQRRALYKKANNIFSLNKKWPDKFRDLSIAAMFFLVITWADFQFSLVNSPLNTAYFLVALSAVIVIVSMIFERRSFCRYACPLTGLLGLYSMFAPVELRSKNRETCKNCREKYCIAGNENGYPCPVFEYPGTMEKNINCILCTECAKTCHRNNISFNIRSFAGDLLTLSKTRTDEALLIIVLLGVTVFQTLIMIRSWTGLTTGLMIYTGAGYDVVRFILFIAVTSSPVLIYAAAVCVSGLLDRKMNFKDIFSGYAYSIIPLGLMMHLSHSLRHLLEEGAAIIPAISDPFGRGLASGYAPAPLLNNDSILLIQWLLMLIGLGFSVSAGRSISRRMFRGNESAYIPVLFFVIIFFALNLWMLGQPIMHKH